MQITRQPFAWRTRVGSGWWPAVLLAVCLPLFTATNGLAAEASRCAVVELYVHADRGFDQDVIKQLRRFAADRGGVELVIQNVEASDSARQRFEQICAASGRADRQTPLAYAAGRVVVADSGAELAAAVADCLKIDVFTRAGCSRCARAKAWLPSMIEQFPGWRLVFHDLSTDAAARTELQNLVARYRTAAASVPVIHVCRRLVVGFDRVETTGKKITETLTTWSRACPDPAASSAVRPPVRFRAVRLQRGDDRQAARSADAEPPLPILPPLPPIADSPDGGAAGDGLPATASQPATVETGIDLPWIGRVEWEQLGMPLFTVVVGLVDGFNPCAMWVLILLLSILVNLRDRLRMVAIAGTFVAVSGAAYFAFMAAWLNVFLLIGYLRPVQLLLGGLAVFVGGVHIKDFFAFKRGVSLSIPESAKPGISQRIRQIVSAENLPAAIAGAFTLAVLVNIVELLCTAGLPALYTNILMQQGVSPAARYGYLLLYILAYMFDDAVMVAIVVASLSRRRMQETEGRWLKLVSGLVILLLGLVMVFRPAWLG